MTTIQTNEAAFKSYIKTGYEYIGIIRNPIGVDVTAAFRGEVVATKFCDEKHMVRILDETKRTEILSFMEAKRKKASDIFGEVSEVYQ